MSSLGSENIKNACRCCLSFGGELINIFSLFVSTNIDFQTKRFTMYDLYKECTQIVIADGDDMPAKICSTCCSRLIESYAFRNKCLKSHHVLQQIINNTEHAHQQSPAVIANVKCSYIENDFTEKDVYKQSNSGSVDSIDMADDSLKQECSNEKAKQKTRLERSPSNTRIAGGLEYFNRNNILKRKKVNVEKLHKCGTCGNEFSTARGLKLHVRLHTGERPEICNVCEKTFSDPKTLINHQICHNGLKPFICDYCDRRFARKESLKYHLKMHTGDRPYACDICDKTYIHSSTLVIHKRTHSDERPFVCKDCEKSFTSRGRLRSHMTIHTGVKNFVCTTCGKTFARNGDLTFHMRVHSGERPYQCDICNKSFSKRSNLQVHHTTHTGEKKFMCSVCGRRVLNLCGLKMHMKQHLESKTFKCILCNKECTTRADLRTHIQTHSGKISLQRKRWSNIQASTLLT